MFLENFDELGSITLREFMKVCVSVRAFSDRIQNTSIQQYEQRYINYRYNHICIKHIYCCDFITLNSESQES